MAFRQLNSRLLQFHDPCTVHADSPSQCHDILVHYSRTKTLLITYACASLAVTSQNICCEKGLNFCTLFCNLNASTIVNSLPPSIHIHIQFAILGQTPAAFTRDSLVSTHQERPHTVSAVARAAALFALSAYPEEISK